jgi:hypothetical protein
MGCQKVSVCVSLEARTFLFVFSRPRGVYLGEGSRAPSFAWNLKTLPLRSLCSYSEIGREVRAFFSVASSRNGAVFAPVMGGT